MIKIAYCGYDFFYRCLDTLCNNENIEVLKVFTFETDNIYNYNTNICEIAKNHNIPLSFERITFNDIQYLFDELKCDYLISAAYPYKIPIGIYRGINIHPTLLPLGRGPWPLPRIILSEQKESGVTIHKLIDKMDSGDILLQSRFAVHKNEDLETLSCRCHLLANKMISTFFLKPDYYWENASPQGSGEYWQYPSDEEMSFSGNMTVSEIDKIVRAYGKFDACTKFLDKSWLVWDVNSWQEEHDYCPGSIVLKTNREYLMAVKDGFVCFRFFKEDI